MKKKIKIRPPLTETEFERLITSKKIYPNGFNFNTDAYKREYRRIMRDRGRFKPFLNEAWVAFLVDFEILETMKGVDYSILKSEGIFKIIFDRYNTRSMYGNYQGSQSENNIKIPIVHIDFPGPLKLHADVGTDKDQTARFHVHINEPLKVFPNDHPPINPDFEL